MSGAHWHFKPTFQWNPLIKVVLRQILNGGNKPIFSTKAHMQDCVKPPDGSEDTGFRSREDNNNHRDGDLWNLRASCWENLNRVAQQKDRHHACDLALANFGMENANTISFSLLPSHSSMVMADIVFLFIKQLAVKFSSKKRERQAKEKELAISSAKLSALIYGEPYQVPSVKPF